jgi:hypothetical protein
MPFSASGGAVCEPGRVSVKAAKHCIVQSDSKQRDATYCVMKHQNGKMILQ